MPLTFAQKKPTPGSRLIASLAAALVFALTVFAASPELHGWLHSHDAGSPPVASPAHAAGPDQDDDCAVVLFAQGVLAAYVLFFVGLFAGRVASYSLTYVPRLVSKAPEFWVPPLCGPPLV